MEHPFHMRTNNETDCSEEVMCDDKGNSSIHDVTSSPSFQNKETPLHKQETTSPPSTSLNENVGFVRALVKEFSDPQRSQHTTRQDKVIQQPSKLKSSGFQVAKGQIQLMVSDNVKSEPHPNISTNSVKNNAKVNVKKELLSVDKDLLTVPTSSGDISISQRLSRSMESLDNILKELSDVISKEPKLAPVDSPKRLSSSLLELNTVDKTLFNNDISKSMISSESCKDRHSISNDFTTSNERSVFANQKVQAPKIEISSGRQNSTPRTVWRREKTFSSLDNKSYNENRERPNTVKPPSVPRQEDRYLEMYDNDWDKYMTPTGRHFYHNPITEESMWDPPRKLVKQNSKGSFGRGKVPFIPRSSNSVYAFGCEKKLNNEPEIASSSSDEETNVMSSSFPSARNKKLLDLDRFSVVRDSIRTSSKNHEKPESPIQVPLGYIELYDKETGLISYRDSNGILWHTNLDAAGKLYFYAKIGNEWRSEWRLPHVKKTNDNFNKNKKLEGLVHFRITFDNHSISAAAINQSEEKDEEKSLWKVLINSELGNWQPVEIEVVPGNDSMSYQDTEIVENNDSQSSRDDEEFQKLKENLYVSSLKYNIESKLVVRFSPPLHFKVTNPSNHNFLLDLPQSKDSNVLSLCTDKKHTSIKMSEEKGVGEQQKHKHHEDTTERSGEYFELQNILSLSSLKNEIKDCSSSNHEKAAAHGVHSGNRQHDINSCNFDSRIVCDEPKDQHIEITLGELFVKLSSCESKSDRENNSLTSDTSQFSCTDSIVSQVNDVNELFNNSHQILPGQLEPPERLQDNAKPNFATKACNDFRWELTEVSSTLIHLRPKSKFLPKEYSNLCLQISCRDTNFGPNSEKKQQLWLQELKKIIASNSLFINKCDTVNKTDRSKTYHILQPVSPKPTLPPRKPRSQSDDIPKEEYAKQLKVSATSFYKNFGDPNAAQDLVKSYIEADKLQQEQKVFRLISTQQSIPANSTSAPVSPLTSKESFPNVPQLKSIEGRGTERPWKHTQKQHHRSHTVKHHKKREGDIQSTSQHTSLISGPTGFKKADPEELYRQLINVSLNSTYALETPTPVEIRIFDFELKDEISLMSDVKFESGIEKDQGILTNNDAAQQSETEDQPKVPKRSFSVRNPRRKPYQKHKREGSEPFVPPPPPVSYSGKYSQPPSSPESVTGTEFSPRLNRKQNRSLSGSRDNLLAKSFRAMATQLRPKSKTSVNRSPSDRTSRFMSLWRGGPSRREQGRDDLMERGIYGLEPVFGNHLKDMPMYKNPKSTDPILDSELHSLPEFVVRCIQKIEKMGATTVGLYRVNGDNAVVQKIRLAIDQGEYKHLDNCKDVSLLCSAFKLFLRELPVPLITREARKALFASQVDFEQNADPKLVAEAVRKAVISLEQIELRVLKYVLRHMKRIADEKENKMDARNLATVFSPNLVHSETSLTKRPESIMYEMEWNNMLVEKLIINVDLIFD